MKPLVNAPLIREHALARGMVAGYVFNEGSGRRINDATGQAPGVFSSAVTKSSVSGWQGSKQGGGLAFNGATEYAQLPEWPFDFERTQPFAFAFRATFANVSETAHPIWTKNVNGGTFRGVGVVAFDGSLASNAMCLQVISTFPSNTLQVVTPVGSVAAGIPYDFVVSYDGSSSASGCFISINGVPQALTATYNSLSATILNDVAPWIGGRSDLAIPGRVLLDYLYIYRRTIGRAEAKAFRADPYQMFDRSPASGIWIPSLNRSAVQRNAVCAWNLRSNASRLAALHWNTRQHASRSALLAWSMRNQSIREAALAWSVRQLAQRSALVAWNVRSQVSVPAQVQWMVRASVSNSPALVWDVRAVLQRVAAIDWHVGQSVALSAGIGWSARALAQRSADVNWSVRAQVTALPAITWKLAGIVRAPAGGGGYVPRAVGGGRPSQVNTARSPASLPQRPADVYSQRPESDDTSRPKS